MLKFLLIFVSIFTFAQKDTLIHRSSYDVLYSQNYRQPKVITYKVIKYSSIVNRYSSNFTSVKGIRTSTSSVYINNVYDKGHMAPAETFSYNVLKYKDTFQMINIALQHYNLNRGPWKTLETRERILARTYSEVLVKITVEFSNIRLKDGSMIPVFFNKELRYNGKIEKYRFPNNQTVKGFSLNYFMIK